MQKQPAIHAWLLEKFDPDSGEPEPQFRDPAATGDIAALEQLVAKGCLRSPMLEWARANGFPCDARVCAEAASHGRLECLQWLRARRVPWDARVCTQAARAGNLEVLGWALANRCPWDSTLLDIAGRQASV